MLTTQNTMNCELREVSIISGAGYSTNYHPSTTETLSSIGYGYNRSITTSPFQHQESNMHLPPYTHHHRMEYGLPPAHFFNFQQPSSQGEYKPAPSKRFHPYIANVNSAHLTLHDYSAIPRNVNLSNSNVMQLTTSPMYPASLPTSSPSLNRCNNCDQICRSAIHRSDHYTTAHDSSGHDASNRPGLHVETEASSSDYVIDNILDLDSQKMVYSPRVDSQVCNHHNTFIPPQQQEIKHVLFLTNQPNNQEFSTSVIQPGYFLHQPQKGHQQQQDPNSFEDAVSLVLSSSSEFPQAHGEKSGIPLAATTSTLPRSAPKRKRTSQKSKNEDRWKLCNCTACDRWFPSPAHLKRHCYTKLHKKETKATAQHDPATVLISHHVPSSEQANNNIHRDSNGQGLLAHVPPQSQDPKSSSEYLPPLKFHVIQGFPQTQDFHHFETAPAVHSTTLSSVVQESHSILVSQSEAILNSMNNTGTCLVIPQQNNSFLQSTTESHMMNSQNQYNTADLLTINTNTTLYPTNIQPELLHPDSITTYHSNEMSEMLSVNDYSSELSSYNASVPYAMPNRLFTESATAACQGDSISYYSQDDKPKTMFQHNHMTLSSTIPPSPVSPVLSSISSPIETLKNTLKMKAICTCTLCDKVFSKACYLKQHNKTFHSDAQFKCTKCGKRFSSKIRRDQHLEKHNGLKPFSCEYDDCEKSFNHKADLQRHKTVHTGQLQHVCENCSKAFVRKDHMLKHMKTRGCKPIVNGKKVQNN